MSEHLPSNPEHIKSPEFEQSPEKTQERAETSHEQHEKQPDSLEAIQKKIEASAKKSKDITVEQEGDTKDEARYLNGQVKINAYNRTMARVRKHLSPVERPFSKAIDNPVVNLASEAAAKTIARPTGLVVGGFITLVGSSTLLYMAKHNGSHYNFGVFLVLFAGGYLVGLIIELIIYIIRRAQRA